MEIAFSTRGLRSICEDDGVAAETFDAAVSDHLKGRLADLRAADTIHDLVVGNPTIARGPVPQVTVDLTDGYKVVCRPNHAVVPLDQDGNVEWGRVRRLQVMDVTR